MILPGFLSKDKFVADVSPIGKEQARVYRPQNNYLSKYSVNDTSVINELNKNKILEEIITVPGCSEKDKEFWE